MDEHFNLNRDVYFFRGYPVLLSLLGFDDELIEKSFDGPKKATGDGGTTEFYNDRDSYLALLAKGLFFEASGEFLKAKIQFEAALGMNWSKEANEHLKRIEKKINNEATGSS